MNKSELRGKPLRLKHLLFINKLYKEKKISREEWKDTFKLIQNKGGYKYIEQTESVLKRNREKIELLERLVTKLEVKDDAQDLINAGTIGRKLLDEYFYWKEQGISSGIDIEKLDKLRDRLYQIYES